MELSKFITYFKEQFDDPEVVELTPATKFRESDEWNSLTGLMTISMVHEKYGVILPAEKLRESVTVEDLFNIIIELSENA